MKKFPAMIVGTIVLLGYIAACKPEPVTEWKPVGGRIMTRWTAEVKPGLVLPEYPRPQLVREEWLNLNGLWDYAIVVKDAGRPAVWDGKILVPFAVESALSGVGKPVGATKELWYLRTIKVPKTWRGGRVLLHFGAVDWESTVWVNGREAGVHRGGYDPFTYDITDALAAGAKQEIVLRVLDPTDEGNSPIVGQTGHEPHGIFYTAVTGIWQTVWMEPVPEAYIAKLKTTPDVDRGTLSFEPMIAGKAEGAALAVTVSRGPEIVAEAEVPASAEAVLTVPRRRSGRPITPSCTTSRPFSNGTARSSTRSGATPRCAR